jgi:SpoVK/Ycf46/Vps4 family AAA+-type ATPase
MIDLLKDESSGEDIAENSSGLKEPSWLKELRSSYLAGEGIMFVLSGNVLDLVPFEDKFVSLKEFLMKGLLSKNKDIALYYDTSAGISFAKPEMRKKFISSLNVRYSLIGEPRLDDALPQHASQVLPVLEQFLKIPGQCSGVVLGYAETIAQAAEINFLTQEERANLVTFQRWASDPALLNSDNLILLITENIADINARIIKNPQIRTIDIPMPEYEERLEFLKYALKNNKVELEMPVEQLAYLTAGLRRIQIEGMLRQAKKTSEKITYQLIKNRKKSIIEDECFGLVELVEPTYNLDTVGGMDSIKNYLRRVVKNIKDGNYRRVPMGIFFVGPMGTGKTFIAEAFAGESGLTCLKLKNFRDKWVGSTEANLEKILNIVKALGSCLIIMDEVDRALGGGDNEGDSGTSSRVYAKIKAFMSDTGNRGKILWLIMSNRPDKLDIDLKRPGRFDSKIPFFYPQNPEELEKVFKALLKKNRINYEVADFSRITAAVTGYSGADLEAILLLSDGFAADAGHEKVLEEDILNAVYDFIPNRDSLTIEFMEYLAVFECSSRQMLPEKYRSLSNEQINERLRELKSILNF